MIGRFYMKLDLYIKILYRGNVSLEFFGRVFGIIFHKVRLGVDEDFFVK